VLAVVLAAQANSAATVRAQVSSRGEGYPVVDDAGVLFERERWANPKILRKEAMVPAAVEKVWEAWTKPEAMKTFFAAHSKIELRPGGAYEMYFSLEPPEGSRGAEGCTILTYVPNELLAFTWNAPPAIPKLREAQARTQVVIRFAAAGPQETKVTLTQNGFGESEDWLKYYEYFDRAWGHVVTSLAQNVKGGTHVPTEPKSTSKNGMVTVRAFDKPSKWQDFEVVLPAQPSDIWRVLTTVDGVKSFYPAEANIEMWPGGKWDLHGGKPNRLMAFVPNEVLAATGSAPEQFPTVQKGGTWGVFLLEPIGENQTRLRLTSVGWKDGGEWDEAYEYFLGANAMFLNMLHEHFAKSQSAGKPKSQNNGSE
jgi:uncharacterized protein YndB with AHSA1/START domain